MALDLSDAEDQSEDTPHHSEALKQILAQTEHREKLFQSTWAQIRTLEEQRYLPRLRSPCEPIQAQIIQAQTIQAQALQTWALESQAFQALDLVAREQARLQSPADLARLLTPMDLAWESKATKALFLRELQYDPIQSLIRDLSHWEAIQRQLVGPWPLVGPWRDAKTLRWLLWALREGNSGDQEAALAQLATMIRRPRLSREASLQLRQRSRLMRMSADDYWRRVVLPHALLLVWGARKTPRRIQLGGNGQGRVLDAQGRWMPQAPIDTLSEELLASYLLDEIPKAAMCILTDQDYPKPANDLWHAPPIERKDDQGTIERIPRVVRLQIEERDLTPPHRNICSPSPEMMAILALDLQKLWSNASVRQRQILELLLKGYSVPEIAAELHVTAQAVHGQIKRLQHKYQAG